MQFLRENMGFTHYRWENEESGVIPVFSGEPSRRVFDPYNGHQVLFLINSYITEAGDLTVVEARSVESRIAHKLPLGLKSERSVLNWLLEASPDEAANAGR
ncbi:MAG: hypothetical protein EOO09_01190 [Chitinophagaceae bacterium]|nr:MAG: hypothetical protein EOO09_01190 [Chitinophagaceae bacterium]